LAARRGLYRGRVSNAGGVVALSTSIAVASMGVRAPNLTDQLLHCDSWSSYLALHLLGCDGQPIRVLCCSQRLCKCGSRHELLLLTCRSQHWGTRLLGEPGPHFGLSHSGMDNHQSYPPAESVAHL